MLMFAVLLTVFCELITTLTEKMERCSTLSRLPI